MTALRQSRPIGPDHARQEQRAGDDQAARKQPAHTERLFVPFKKLGAIGLQHVTGGAVFRVLGVDLEGAFDFHRVPHHVHGHALALHFDQHHLVAGRRGEVDAGAEIRHQQEFAQVFVVAFQGDDKAGQGQGGVVQVLA